MRSALEYMLGPREAARFSLDGPGSSPIHVARECPTYFDGLFSLDSADELLSRSDLWWPAIRVFHRGRQLEAREITERWCYGRERFEHIIDRGRLYRFFASGATLNILGLERMWPSVMELNRGLEEEAGFPVHTTAFLTPNNATNIPPHYDMVEFFALQVDGCKRWRLWKADRRLPLVRDEDAARRIYREGDAAVQSNRLLGEYVLEPGDTLYVPRGTIHQAVTTESHSLHVTVGVNVHRWFDLIEFLARAGVSALSDNLEFRKALPPNGLESTGAHDARETFFAMTEFMRRFMKLHLSSGIHALDRALLEGRYPARPGQLLDLRELNSLNLHSRLSRRANLLHSITERDGKVILKFHSKTLSCASRFAKPLRFVASGHVFRIKDVPGLVDDADKIAFVRRMVAEGFLTRLSEHEAFSGIGPTAHSVKPRRSARREGV